MTTYLHVTFGSQAVLQDIQHHHSERGLLLTVDAADKDRYQLLDLTNAQQSVFAMPTTYAVLASFHATLDIRGWLNFDLMTLPDLQRDNFMKRFRADADLQRANGLINAYLLQRTDNLQQVAVLTTWQTEWDWQRWHSSPSYLLNNYEKDAVQYSFLHKQYRFAAFMK